MAVVRLSSSPRLCSSYFVMGESYPQLNRWRAGVCLWPKSLGVELTCRIVGVIPSTLVRTVDPQDTIAPDADPARRAYKRFSVDLFGSLSLGWVALRVDLERCRVTCARCTVVYVVYQHEVCPPSLGGNVAAQVATIALVEQFYVRVGGERRLVGAHPACRELRGNGRADKLRGYGVGATLPKSAKRIVRVVLEMRYPSGVYVTGKHDGAPYLVI